MALANKYRPQLFRDVVAQTEAVDLLRSVVQRPAESIRTLIAHGPHGTGKTTLARIFARTLACQFRKGADACGQCEDCHADIESTPYYQEYDATKVGNKEWLTDYKQQLEYSGLPKGRWLVVVFDEAHAISKAGQDSMLKLLEEAPRQVFFVLCSTNPEKIIDTIRSRALELPLESVAAALVVDRLRQIAKAEQIDVADEVLHHIANCSGGHMRDAVMRIDAYNMLTDKSAFTDMVASGSGLVLEFLTAVRQQDKIRTQQVIASMVRRPLARLRQDWEQTVLELVKQVVGVGSSLAGSAEVAGLYNQDVFRLMQALSAEWADGCWRDDAMAQAYFWFMYYSFGKAAAPAKPADSMSSFRKT